MEVIKACRCTEVYPYKVRLGCYANRSRVTRLILTSRQVNEDDMLACSRVSDPDSRFQEGSSCILKSPAPQSPTIDSEQPQQQTPTTIILGDLKKGLVGSMSLMCRTVTHHPRRRAARGFGPPPSTYYMTYADIITPPTPERRAANERATASWKLFIRAFRRRPPIHIEPYVPAVDQIDSKYSLYF